MVALAVSWAAWEFRVLRSLSFYTQLFYMLSFYTLRFNEDDTKSFEVMTVSTIMREVLHGSWYVSSAQI